MNENKGKQLKQILSHKSNAKICYMKLQIGLKISQHSHLKVTCHYIEIFSVLGTTS